MDERGANIDLLFRNGLKDYEVLPPQDVWPLIQPSVKVAPKSFPVLKTAAIVTALTTMTFLAYRWGKEIPVTKDMSFAVMDVKYNAPVFSTPVEKSVIPISGTYKPADIKEVPLIGETTASDINSSNDIADRSEFTALNDISAFALPNSSLQRGPSVSITMPRQKKSYEMVITEPQYYPEAGSLKNDKRWSIGALASPTYYSNFNSDKNVLAKQLASSEKSLLSYSGGVAVGYKINKRFSIQSGVYYSSLGQEVDGVSSFGGFSPYVTSKGDHNFEILTTSGPVYTNNPDIYLMSTGKNEKVSTAYTKDVFDPVKANLQVINSFSITQNFSYLELPVLLKYKIIDKAIDFNLIGGVSYNFLVNNSVFAKSGGEKVEVGDTKGLNPITLSSSLGMGMEYNISGKLSLNLEPTFRYYLNPFDAVTGSKNHPYSFGIFSGLSYKF